MSAQASVQAMAKSNFKQVTSGILQRCTATTACDECRKNREGTLQRAAVNSSPVHEVPPVVHEVLRSPGQPLNQQTRAFMEPRFGLDFSQVRIHTHTHAMKAAHSVNARAYTVGRDIVFGASQYSPRSRAGLQLLAHELAHVVQQNASSAPALGQLQLNPSRDRFEDEADRAADVVMTQEPKSLSTIAHRSAGLSILRPCIQRTATFVEGSVSAEFNLAEQLATGKPSGNTDFVLNGTPFTSGTSFTTERQALNTPRIGSATRRKGVVECWFHSVPDNEVSYEMKVLKSGAWIFVTTKANMAARFPALNACQAGGDGAATLVVKGMPTNEDQRRRTRTHENHHVSDYETILNDLLVPWERRVAAAHKHHQTMLGTSADDCEKKLSTAFVGQKQTPDDIVTEIIKKVNDKAGVFHRSPAGRDVNISNVQTDRACGTVTAEAR
jgi:hypothetical protein